MSLVFPHDGRKAQQWESSIFPVSTANWNRAGVVCLPLWHLVLSEILSQSVYCKILQNYELKSFQKLCLSIFPTYSCQAPVLAESLCMDAQILHCTVLTRNCFAEIKLRFSTWERFKKRHKTMAHIALNICIPLYVFPVTFPIISNSRTVTFSLLNMPSHFWLSVSLFSDFCGAQGMEDTVKLPGMRLPYFVMSLIIFSFSLSASSPTKLWAPREWRPILCEIPVLVSNSCKDK